MLFFLWLPQKNLCVSVIFHIATLKTLVDKKVILGVKKFELIRKNCIQKWNFFSEIAFRQFESMENISEGLEKNLVSLK